MRDVFYRGIITLFLFDLIIDFCVSCFETRNFKAIALTCRILFYLILCKGKYLRISSNTYKRLQCYKVDRLENDKKFCYFNSLHFVANKQCFNSLKYATLVLLIIEIIRNFLHRLFCENKLILYYEKFNYIISNGKRKVLIKNLLNQSKKKTTVNSKRNR